MNEQEVLISYSQSSLVLTTKGGRGARPKLTVVKGFIPKTIIKYEKKLAKDFSY